MDSSDTRTAAVSGLLIGGVGAVAWCLEQPWVFPSLGPTAMLMAESPDRNRPWQVWVGHGVGVLSALGMVALVGAGFVACASATFLTVLGNLRTGARHAPAVATTLLLALGTLPATLEGGVQMLVAVGVLLLLQRAIAGWCPGSHKRGIGDS